MSFSEAVATRYYLAVDIGASSGRHVLGWVENGLLRTEEVYRFENSIRECNGQKCWDIEALFGHVVAGMRRCNELGKIPHSLGIDTWAVDYVLLDQEGKRLGEVICYRDSRTEGVLERVEEQLPFQEIYKKTGIQKQPFNTLYQLVAEQTQTPNRLDNAQYLLMVPEYLNYLLTGKRVQEYTNATSTGLVNATEKKWDLSLLEALNLPRHLFNELHLPGSVVGDLLPQVRENVGFNTLVLLPATHDTASAFLAVPTEGEDSVFLSSGTWSLLGVENSTPLLSEEACRANFTNEGGYAGRYRFLKNIMGLWMVQNVRHELGQARDFVGLAEQAKQSHTFKNRVPVNAPCFLSPDSMIEAVQSCCKEMGQTAPFTAGEIMECVYRSLADCYAQSIEELQCLTGKRYARIHIIGGGSQDQYLNQLTADATGLPVYAGPIEGTVVGNLLAQMLEEKVFQTIDEARAAVKKSFPIAVFPPQTKE